MKNLKLAVLGCAVLCSSMTMAVPTINSLQTQAYGLYALYHPEVKNTNVSTFSQSFAEDYNDLFKNQKSVNREQYLQFEQERLASVMQQRRDMSVKQAHVRFGVLNSNKDDKITLKEYQAVGLKTFDHFDKNQDGLVNAADAQLDKTPTGTHDGLKIKSPLSMPMPSTVNDFIQMYAVNNNSYVTLGDYLSHRDQQFFATDTNKDGVLSEQEYVTEFTQRYDEHSAKAKSEYDVIFTQQFQSIAGKKDRITQKDLQNYAKKLYKSLDVK
ncbi:hypothetical protein [Acinetobacter sp. MD2]|uniref:hypothetical protein n=1 Tax=Acinetobacter sp. MD2 TaxID=2600066 RepID=UPI002D1E633A|nr:hypothetical protein [Acinetobacter sp. MD2]MEB3767851.1 hypothetical protein [Acinetobacter sp. MD2]